MNQAERNKTVAWVLLLVSVATLGYVAGKSNWSIDPRTWVTPSTVATSKVFALIHETGDDDAAFSSLKVATRKDDFAKQLAAKGITLLILDKDQAGKYMPKDGWPKLPAVVAVSKEDKPAAVESLPSVNLSAVTTLIEKHGGPLK